MPEDTNKILQKSKDFTKGAMAKYLRTRAQLQEGKLVLMYAQAALKQILDGHNSEEMTRTAHNQIVEFLKEMEDGQ